MDIYPYRPNSLVGWVLLFVLGLPVGIILELIGNRILGEQFTRLGFFERVLYGVVTLGAILLLIWFGFSYVTPYLGKWGF